MEKRLSRFALYDDAKECTFKPKISRRGSSEAKEPDDHDDDAAEERGGTRAFMERQEAMEKSKQRELEVARKKKDYEASLDRKSCPVSASVRLVLFALLSFPLYDTHEVLIIFFFCVSMMGVTHTGM